MYHFGFDSSFYSKSTIKIDFKKMYHIYFVALYSPGYMSTYLSTEGLRLV